MNWTQIHNNDGVHLIFCMASGFGSFDWNGLCVCMSESIGVGHTDQTIDASKSWWVFVAARAQPDSVVRKSNGTMKSDNEIINDRRWRRGKKRRNISGWHQHACWTSWLGQKRYSIRLLIHWSTSTYRSIDWRLIFFQTQLGRTDSLSTREKKRPIRENAEWNGVEKQFAQLTIGVFAFRSRH